MGVAMLRFLDGLNETRKAELLRQLRSVWTHDSTVAAHMRFTAIHPFYDGNGRLARLIANLPVLIAGYPPIVIPMECREDYIRAIWAFEDDPADDKPFVNLVRTAWQKSLDLVAEARGTPIVTDKTET